MGAAEQVKSAATTDAVDQLLADAPDAIVILEAHGRMGRMVRVNTRAEKLLGYSQEELLEQKPDMRWHGVCGCYQPRSSRKY